MKTTRPETRLKQYNHEATSHHMPDNYHYNLMPKLTDTANKYTYLFNFSENSLHDKKETKTYQQNFELTLFGDQILVGR